MGGGVKQRPLQFLGEDLQIRLYMHQNLHKDLVNFVKNNWKYGKEQIYGVVRG